MKTINVIIWGVVQGVGFRPFLTKLANQLGLVGWVINEGGYVKATLSGNDSNIDDFLVSLRNEKPEPAEIVHIDINEVDYIPFEAFDIKESTEGSEGLVMLPADLSICPTCLKELDEEQDRRFNHPFISCMECGPRYSIIDIVPYDRHNTSMVDFPMCEKCEAEYTDKIGRRYHAQTISCHECGPYLKYKKLYNGKNGYHAETDTDVDTNADTNVDTNVANDAYNGHYGAHEKTDILIKYQALIAAIEDVKNGGIIAIKGIGGYHFACRPDIDECVKNLRELKGREEKPFAVMFPNIEELKEYCLVSELEEVWLTGKEKPILLLETKEKRFSSEVSRSSRLLGAFLPYTPLQKLILKETGPLIMTSANISDEPIIIDEEEIFSIKKRFVNNESKYLTSILFNDRKIRTGEDDSVARVYGDKFRIIRRARGFVPVPIFIEGLNAQIKGLDTQEEKKSSISDGIQIFATGGQLKNTFCVSKGSFSYVSQHHGDLEDFRTNETFIKNTERVMEMMRIKPEIIVCDMHPRYFTTRFAETFSKDRKISLIKVQHHHAHAASVAAEHSINEKHLAIVFDGTGYGTDGKIWGGEFLICDEEKFERFAHLEYVKLIGGDSSMKDVWKSGMGFVFKANEEYSSQFLLISSETSDSKDALNEIDNKWKIIRSALVNDINTFETSSMGRLFDAVSFLLGLTEKSNFEGEAAILLENKANEFLGNIDKPQKYYEVIEPIEKSDCLRLSFDKGIKIIIEEIKKTYELEIKLKNALQYELEIKLQNELQNELQKKLAWEFHENVVNACVEISKKSFEKNNTKVITLSGGVFQNRYLLENTINKLAREGFKVYSNEKVPVNDGGISLGQQYIAGIKNRKECMN